MKIFTDKTFSKITKPLSKSYRQASACLSASFGRNLMYYDAIIRHPEDYFEWAEKSAADMVMAYFKELCKHDIVCAEQLYEMYRFDLWKIVKKTYNIEDPSEYFKFYYDEAKRKG